jgi:hypothetical protein
VILGFDDLNLSINTDMATVVKAMAQPDSGLEIRDRMWLKITIPNAFIGKSLDLLKLYMYIGNKYFKEVVILYTGEGGVGVLLLLIFKEIHEICGDFQVQTL